MNSNESGLNKPVFFASVVIIFIVTILGALIPEQIGQLFTAIKSWLNSTLSWFYMLTVGAALIFCFVLMFSRYGDIKLGPDHSTPDYSYGSWLAMLFSAGMGIGLLFFGVAEPVMHLVSPPNADPQSIQAAREAMNITFFHWGLHAWGIYALLAISLAYFAYRHNLPLLPRSIVYPLFKDKIFGPIGHIIDTFAVVGTMFGVATSLGFGVTQVNSGLSYLTGIPESFGVQFILIAVITTFATISVVMGLDGGIKKISNLNMIIAVGLLLTVLVVGPTAHIFNSFTQNLGIYLGGLVKKTFNLYSYDPKEKWIGGWTLLYWGWWVSWCPFVGMFIARISRGRTIREFLVSVLFIPTGFTFAWMTVFGNTAIDAILHKGESGFAAAVAENVPVSLFKFFELLPGSTFLSILGVLLVTTFFVTSSDSGSLVIDTLTSGGAEEPPVWQRIFWAVTEGLVAAALLYAGGLESLQAMTISSAFPIMIILIIAAYCLFKELREDYNLREAVTNPRHDIFVKKPHPDWKERLKTILDHPKKDEVKEFIETEVVKSFETLKTEFLKNDLKAEITQESEKVTFTVLKDECVDFIYEVRLIEYILPENIQTQDREKLFLAEVFLFQGGANYSIYDFTTEQIIGDVIEQYDRHLQFLRSTQSLS